MLSAWDIREEDLVAITTDNGANIVKAAELNNWMQCFGHRLHLAILMGISLGGDWLLKSVFVCVQLLSSIYRYRGELRNIS